jgi:hypothetical protein
MASMSAPVFARKLERARKELLTEIVNKEVPTAPTYEVVKNFLKYPSGGGSSGKLKSEADLPKSPMGGRKPMAMGLTVRSPEMVLKTMVNEESTVLEIITKLRRKFPGDTASYGLAVGKSVGDVWE